MRTFVANVPLFLPGMVLVAGLALLIAPLLARFLRTSRVHAALLVVALGLTLMATFTPTIEALTDIASHSGACDLSRRMIASPRTLLTVNPTSLNVLLFVPLGIALGSLPSSRRAAGLVVLAFLLPIAIELFQLMLPALGRQCSSADIVDNAMGLTIGLALGFGARRLLLGLRRT
jgi:hypothetical protein